MTTFTKLIEALIMVSFTMKLHDCPQKDDKAPKGSLAPCAPAFSFPAGWHRALMCPQCVYIRYKEW